MKISFKPTEKSPRVTAEKKLAQEFMSILQGHHREIRGHQDTGASERRILSRTSYQNWGLGLTLGALTFGTLTGLTLRQARVAARFAVQRRPAAARYRDLDAAGPRHTESTQVATSNNTDDVWITAQMLIYGATSLVVTVASSWCKCISWYAQTSCFFSVSVMFLVTLTIHLFVQTLPVAKIFTGPWEACPCYLGNPVSVKRLVPI